MFGHSDVYKHDSFLQLLLVSTCAVCGMDRLPSCAAGTQIYEEEEEVVEEEKDDW